MKEKDNTQIEIDEKDRKILDELQKDCRQTNKSLEKKIGLPETTIRRRIVKLEKSGIIKKYQAILDPKKLGQPASALIYLKTRQYTPEDRSSKQKENAIWATLNQLATFPEIQQVYGAAGEDDIIIKVHGKDAEDISLFVINKLRMVPRIDRSRTTILLFATKESVDINLEEA